MWHFFFMLYLIMGGFTAFLVAIISSLLYTAPSPTVHIGTTRVSGSNFGGVDFFGGIPYAEPPIGELRLKHPVISKKINTKTFNAKKSGPGCLQTPDAPSGVSEDCLTMDIYRPAGITPETKLPVLFWIHGGGFTVGSSSYYNGTELVARSINRGTPIVFIAINYRLGPLGSPQGIEAGRRKIMNLGIYDQLAALEWVQENIHTFGGDKTKVTIQGESMGAVCVQTLLLQPHINKLARAAIIQSGSILPIFGPERNEAQWQQYVAAIPACTSAIGTNNTFECIRSTSSQSLHDAIVRANVTFMSMAYLPVIDGPGGLNIDRFSQITTRPNLPLLIGETLDEGTMLAPQGINSELQIRGLVTAFIAPSLVKQKEFETRMNQIFELYPDDPARGAPFRTGEETFGLSSHFKRCAAILGDLLIHSSRRILCQEAGAPLFAYQFTDGDAVIFPEFAPLGAAPGSLGVAHSAEIPYIFGTLVNRTPEAAALSTKMQDYWLSFVTSLHPNDGLGDKRPKWERYTQAQGLLNLDGQVIEMVSDDYRLEQLNFWQENADFLHR